MNSDKHIDNVTMGLFVTGYRQLRKRTRNQIMKHLHLCELCFTEFESQMKEESEILDEEFTPSQIEKIKDARKRHRKTLKGPESFSEQQVETPSDDS